MKKTVLATLALAMSAIMPLPAQVNELQKSSCKEFGAFNIFASDTSALLISLDDALNSALSNNIALNVENY